jgi:hypothetical protein
MDTPSRPSSSRRSPLPYPAVWAWGLWLAGCLIAYSSFAIHTRPSGGGSVLYWLVVSLTSVALWRWGGALRDRVQRRPL